MYYAEIAPSKDLAKYVKCFWTLEQSSAEAACAPEPVIPDGCIEIIFNLADRFRRHHRDGSVETQSSAIVAGQMREFAQIEPTGRVSLLGIRFRHAGAYPFFRFSLADLTGRIEDLSSVWTGDPTRFIEERLAASITVSERVAVIEAALIKLLAENRKYDPIVENASDLILNNSGVVSISALAKSLEVSERKLERRFQQRFGLTPKFFSRIVRFQNLLRTLNEKPDADLLGAALSYGYYDQAHLIHEFNEFAGESPLAYFENEYRFSQFFVSTAKG